MTPPAAAPPTPPHSIDNGRAERSSELSAEITLDDGSRVVMPVHVRPVADSESAAVVVPLPDAAPATLTLVLHEDGLWDRAYTVGSSG